MWRTADNRQRQPNDDDDVAVAILSSFFFIEFALFPGSFTKISFPDFASVVAAMGSSSTVEVMTRPAKLLCDTPVASGEAGSVTLRFHYDYDHILPPLDPDFKNQWFAACMFYLFWRRVLDRGRTGPGYNYCC